MSGVTKTGRQPAGGQQRAEREYLRRKVFQPASLRLGLRRERAHVLDISLGGARLHCPGPCAPGDMVELRVCSLTTCARVMWRRGDRMGVRFSRVLAEREIDSLFD